MTGLYSLHADEVVIDEGLGLESDLDQMTYELYVLLAVGATVDTDRHQQLLGWPRQLGVGRGTKQGGVSHIF